MPFNTAGLPNANSGPFPDDQLFLAGDVRANENIELTAVQTLFVREHNRVAGLIQQANPSLTDDQIYQMARAYVTAEEQSITFNEFLPALLGSGVITAYHGYNPRVNPGIANEFSTAAYRFGHSLLAPDVQFLNNDGTTAAPELSLANAFFNPPVVVQNGVDTILKYLASDNAQEVDTKIVPQLQNFLFGPPGAGGFDLASLNIQRGRDHGLADYNSTRVAYGLPKVKSFADITSNPQLQAQLQQLYGSVNNIDLWVGGLAEDHVPGGSVGPLFTRIIADQFQRLRDGDRLWFENIYSGSTLNTLEHTTLADIIRWNTTISNVQNNVFFYDPVITGRVVRSGSTPSGAPAGVPGVTVQLLDTGGNVVATTVTNVFGFYLFQDMDLGTYRVRQVLPPNWVQISPNPADVMITRSMVVAGVNFVDQNTSAPSPGPGTGGTGGWGWGQGSDWYRSLADILFALGQDGDSGGPWGPGGPHGS
jgi:hypothetical protein